VLTLAVWNNGINCRNSRLSAYVAAILIPSLLLSQVFSNVPMVAGFELGEGGSVVSASVVEVVYGDHDDPHSDNRK
jgi:Na+/H+ antiporter NhaD/arsenite permease-like protein